MVENGRMPERLAVGSVETPLGDVWVAASEAGVRVMTVPDATEEECLTVARKRGSEIVEDDERNAMLNLALCEVRRYFDGTLKLFTVPLDLRGTEFQQRVWSAVAAVPYGATVTYREIADQIGAPRAFRAVGAANGANPAAIIVPCHRIIGSSGGLRGYGGGLHQKRALLDLEATHRDHR
jgi:O-6-methylguanine DNA methyltransferase